MRGRCHQEPLHVFVSRVHVAHCACVVCCVLPDRDRVGRFDLGTTKVRVVSSADASRLPTLNTTRMCPPCCLCNDARAPQNLEQVFGMSRWRWVVPVPADGVHGDGVCVAPSKHTTHHPPPRVHARALPQPPALTAACAPARATVNGRRAPTPRFATRTQTTTVPAPGPGRTTTWRHNSMAATRPRAATRSGHYNRRRRRLGRHRSSSSSSGHHLPLALRWSAAATTRTHTLPAITTGCWHAEVGRRSSCAPCQSPCRSRGREASQ